jgi:hypothetical protein
VRTVTEYDGSVMTRGQRCALMGALLDADDRHDAVALAQLGWVFFDLLCRAQQAKSDAVDMLDELTAAARAVVAGGGSQAAVGQVRDVLATHGWLRQPVVCGRNPESW